MDQTIKNPILPGFYPDPSICRVGNDFYMITSSFMLFPGVPIFHSTDLATWNQIGNVLDRPSQLHLIGQPLVGGIMAPTIRYHDGVFYIINTNFSSKGNFIVTAEEPQGPWSEPIWLPDVTGIDPSLFFDEDGSCYVCGTRQQVQADGTQGPQVIWMAEFDLDAMKLKSSPVDIWGGALVNAPYPEAPHLYKKDGWYYLIIAEGGTEHFHAVTVARSRALNVWFDGYKGNPILTHRHLGKNYPIGNAGHADLVETVTGEWYAVLLASRLIGGYHKNLGRETYLVPVDWEDGWPVLSPGTGKIEWTYPAPALPPTPRIERPARVDFDQPELDQEFIFFGTPYQDFWRIHNGWLTMKLLPQHLSPEQKKIQPGPSQPDPTIPSLAFIGKRQTDVNFQVATRLKFTAEKSYEAAGLAIVQASNHQLRLERTVESGKQILRLVQVTCDARGMPFHPDFTSKTHVETLVAAECPWEDVVLVIRQNVQAIDFLFGPDEQSLRLLAGQVDGRVINPEKVGGMIGTCLGMFATANGEKSDNIAGFDWFEYRRPDERIRGDKK
ncbi:MAG: glycoside hydrolase family 43 protein [Saccharofermentanales bacterium]